MKRRTLFLLIVSGLLAVAIAAAAWAATSANNEPAPAAARFAITIDGFEIASFSQLGVVSGIDPSQLELVSGTPMKLPGKRVPPTVTLKRGMTRGTELWEWQKAALSGDAAARKDVDVVVYTADGSPIARYYLENAWPAKLEIGALTAGSPEVLMETVTIVSERIQRVSV